MEGLECSEIMLGRLDIGDRLDSDYFQKQYLDNENRLENVKTTKLGVLCSLVASAFYPAATQLYEIGDIPFVRCVDCISHNMITNDQENSFEKIPYEFAVSNNGISFLYKNDIVITKVGSPCFASVVTDFEKVALSRTVLGLTNIQSINPFYLMIFLRSEYGFSQLLRQRELTIQYQLTLARVKNIDVFLPSSNFQKCIENMCLSCKKSMQDANVVYHSAEQLLLKSLGLEDWQPKNEATTIKKYSDYEKSGRLDAEYYQPKYEELLKKLAKYNLQELEAIVTFKKSIEPGSECYQTEGVPFVRVSDISQNGISETDVCLNENEFDVNSLMPRKDTILFSKDGSVGIAYKLDRDYRCITSGALLHLNIINDDYLADYLTLVLNSVIVQLQAERDVSGAIIQHWKPSEIEKVLIPKLDKSIQKDIADKVQESFRLRQQSQELLECAKRAVEMAIEENETKAMEWLKLKLQSVDESKYQYFDSEEKLAADLKGGM